ncbi:PQQ-dependent sugar dehydrogenase [Halorarius litoreus]|uniref:PQQ-dependent sugar dehydrogenase n=1 Tax=Halorarius litoreus TaxID=2962676 RepID=UPI0020CC6B33|nr:PQQ-dependent sugar dehydrogenase [Halorarius litoreus]
MDRRRFLALAGTGVATTLAGCVPTLGSEPQATEATEADVRAETVATGLRVPWGADYRDGTLYLTERRGRVVRVVDGTVEPVVDLSESVETGGEGGLLGLAFHPDADVAFTYQTYLSGASRKNRVVRHDLTDDWAGEAVLDGIPGAPIHDGGRLLVWDGALYVTSGDAADRESAQDRDALSGKVHRLTLDGDPHPNNPFETTVFTWGHRNPQGLATRENRLFATEHGPDTDDEINLLEAGNNYGWPEVKGTDGGEGFTPALDAFTPTIAPGGAVFYPENGPIEAWRGDLLFGTLVGSHLHRTRIEGAEVVANNRQFTDQFGRLRTTFVGPDSHLYAVTSNRDGRGSPQDGDDRVLRFRPA